MQSLQMTSLMSELVDPFCIELCAYLSAQLPTFISEPIQFTPDADGEQRHKLLYDQAVDIAWICGLLYTETVAPPLGTYRPCVAPCMVGEDGPVYYGELITQHDKPLQRASAEHLQNISWAYNELESFSGYNIMRAYFEKLDQDQAHFGDIICSGSHLNSLAMVRQGQVDCATLDSTMLQMLVAKEPALMEEITVVERIGPYAMPPLTLSSNSSEELFIALQMALLNMHKDEVGARLLAAWQISHFEVVEDSTYDDIRALMARTKEMRMSR